MVGGGGDKNLVGESTEGSFLGGKWANFWLVGETPPGTPPHPTVGKTLIGKWFANIYQNIETKVVEDENDDAT